MPDLILSTSDRPARPPRVLQYVAVTAWLVSVIFTALGLWLLSQTLATPIGPRWGPRGLSALFGLTYSTVGVLITSRRPHNPIGWLFCCTGFAGASQMFTEEYAVYAVLAYPGSLPAGVWAAWVQEWIWVPAAVPAMTFMLLLFPEGRLLSRRWRPATWLAAFSTVSMTFLTAAAPGPLEMLVDLENPFAIPLPARHWETVGLIAQLAWAASVLVSVASLIIRFRRSTGEERQQLKWFVYAAAFVGPGILGTMAIDHPIGPLSLIVPMLAIPVATGIAVLRHRLYDIDVLIHRTLVYSALTGMLGVLYLGSVVLLQAGFRATTGQSSDLAIVVSTLAIAALFSPLRRRVQAFIDRRFYRHKYDAAKALAAYGTVARDEVNLRRLTERLLAVVEDTMRPVHASVWLRPSARGRGERRDT